MGETEEKEQVTTPPEEEDKGKEPSNVSEAVEDFYKEKAKEKPSEVETEEEESPAEKEAEEKEEEEKKEEEEEKPESPELPPELTKLDEFLKASPFMIEVDGKEVEINSAEKLRTYTQFGYKGYERMGELKRKEEELQKGADDLKRITDGIQKAKDEGRLIIKPLKSSEQPSEEEKAEEEEEEEELDPAMKEMRKEIKELKKKNEDLTMAYLEDKVEFAKKKLDEEKEELTKKYPYYSEKEFWHNLAETEDGKPKYTIEEAMKLSHDEGKKRFEKFLKDNPEYHKATKEEKEKIIAEYQAEEKKREEAPVSPPSETPAGGTPPQGEDKGDYKDPQEGYEAFLKVKKAEMEAGKKS